METRVEYGWVGLDPETGKQFVAKAEWKGERLRVRPVEIAPAETRTIDIEWSGDGRTGRLVGKLHLEPLVLPAEIKTGADGRPVVRPITTAPRPEPQAWERLVGPLYRIEPEEITRYWTVEDRPLDELQAERTTDIRAEMARRIADRLIDSDDAGDIRAAGRAALAEIGKAETPRAVAEISVVWPA